MKSPSTAAGAFSGCLIWMVLMGAFSLCLIPAAFVAALFTETSDLAVQTIGPIVCPANSKAKIVYSSTTTTNEQGTELQARGAEMVCVNSDGKTVAEPAPLPNWLWNGVLSLAAVALAGVLALVFAAPAGVLAGKLTSRFLNRNHAQRF
jgi:hypothetical protein